MAADLTHIKLLNYGFPDRKVHGANMGPIWGRQDPGGPHAGPMNFAMWVNIQVLIPHVVCSNILYEVLTLWCRATHMCVGNLNRCVSDNGLAPGRH